MFVLSLLLSLLSPEAKLDPPPLTEEQKTRIQTLVRNTQAEMARIRTRLDEAQKELSRHYANFDLDLAAVEKLQQEVLDLQKRQLAGYHRLHVELRGIVGRERFEILRQRIDNILNSPRKEK